MIRDEIWETMRKIFQKIFIPKMVLPEHDISPAVIFAVAREHN